MPIRLVTAQEMRALDRAAIEKFGIPSFTLMQRAATGAADILRRTFSRDERRRILVVAGKGNNGGDGMVCARLLARSGSAIRVALMASPRELKGDAARAFEELGGTRVGVATDVGIRELGQMLTEATLVVDALLGTGLNTPVTGRFAEAICAMNGSGKPIFSLDVPSGLDADRGIPLGVAVCAAATVTFGLAKLGLFVYPGRAFSGKLHVVDIGIPEPALGEISSKAWALEATDVARRLPVRPPTAHKGNCGHVLVVGGALGRTGAAKMAAEAALRAGAGLVTLAGPATVQHVSAAHLPEIMTVGLPDTGGALRFDERALSTALEGKNAVVVGPGMGTSEDCERIVKWFLERPGLPIVCDADALTCLSRASEWASLKRAQVVVTPHPGEFSRLTGHPVAEVQGNRPALAREFATRHTCTLVLKGASTVVAEENGTLWVNPTGNPGMAAGGMGDVLAGLIGGFLAQGLRPVDAAIVSVFIHGASADALSREYAAVGFLATEVAREVPRQLHALRGR
ncbi:MAG: bifunctional NAD(P)H-hydrate repair enzyme [Candidatus Binatia bacterium]|nr:MAG: bifunctional NAD(P)H-hydrate repair enzyme [Candidatus Binatia bacterium]